MIALKIKTGECFDIFALEEDGKCEVFDFLNLMDRIARPVLLKLVKDFDRTADIGLMQNAERFRALEAEIYEFRVPGEVQVLCFLDGNSTVVLTNGFNGQRVDAGISHAIELRDRYFEAKRNGYLTYREDLL